MIFKELLFGAYLVLWCFKSVKCVEFWLSKLFQYSTFAVPEHLDTPSDEPKSYPRP